MKLHMLRRTLISVASIKRQLGASNLTHFPFSTLVLKSEKSSAEITNYFMNRHQFSPDLASVAAASILMYQENYKKSDIIIDYFKENGLSNAQLEEMLIRNPAVLRSSLECIKPKVQKLQELGFCQSEIAELLCSMPTLSITSSPNRIAESIVALRNVLETNHEVVKLLKVCCWFLSGGLERRMIPNIELMESIGVSLVQIKQHIFSFPRFFLINTEFLRYCVRIADEMGLSRDSKMYIHGIRAVSSMNPEKWKSKLKLLKDLGFSQDDILFMFRRSPQVFATSETKIIEVTKLLLSLANKDISYVAKHPEFFIYSATRRIRPRLEIIDILNSKGLLSKQPEVPHICRISDKYFIQKFVVPYASDLGEFATKFIAIRGLLV